MSRIYVTGDRSVHPALALPLIAVAVVREIVGEGSLEDFQIVTGDAPGIEEGVTALCQLTGINLVSVGTPATDEGYPDWDTRHRLIDAMDIDKALVIHSDPHASRIAKSALEVFGERCTLLTPDLMSL